MGHISQEFGFVFTGKLQFICFFFNCFLSFHKINIFFIQVLFLFFKGLGVIFKLLIGHSQLFLLSLQLCF